MELREELARELEWQLGSDPDPDRLVEAAIRVIAARQPSREEWNSALFVYAHNILNQSQTMTVASDHPDDPYWAERVTAMSNEVAGSFKALNALIDRALVQEVDDAS